MDTNTGGTTPAPTFDSVFDSFFGDDIELSDTGSEAGDASTDQDGGSLSDDEGNPQERDLDGDGNTEDDDPEGGEGGDGEDEGDDPDTDPEGDDPQASGRDGKGNRTEGKPGEKSEHFFDRKKIDQIQDPQAKAVAESAYKEMQKAFTQKTTELAAERKTWQAKVSEADQFRSEYQNFVEEIASPEGAEQFLHLVVESRPHVFTPEVLVSLALKKPELFEKAVERYQQLSADEDARTMFQDKLDLGRGKYEDGQRRRAEARTAQASSQQHLLQAVKSRAGTHQVSDPDSLEIIQGQVSLLIQKNRQAQKKTTLAEVNETVDRVAKRLAKARDTGRQEGERLSRAQRQDAVRQQARRAKDGRPAPAGRRTPIERGDYKPPARNSDRSRALVDHYFPD